MASKNKSKKKTNTVDEHIYKALVEAAQDFIYIFDKKLNLTNMNPAGAKLFNDKPENLIGRTVNELFPDDEAKKISKTFKSIIESKEPFIALENIKYCTLTFKLPYGRVLNKYSLFSAVILVGIGYG